jgi:hypothetical protein
VCLLIILSSSSLDTVRRGAIHSYTLLTAIFATCYGMEYISNGLREGEDVYDSELIFKYSWPWQGALVPFGHV